MFRHCEQFNQSLDKWNVSNVKDMFSMFYGCYKFNKPLINNQNIKGWSYVL